MPVLRQTGRALPATTTLVEETEKRPIPARGVLSPAHSRISTLYHKLLNKSPESVQHMVATVLNRVQDPDPEIAYLNYQEVTQSQIIRLGWFPILALVAMLGVLLVACTYTAARYGATGIDNFFWLGILLIFVPPVIRLISPAASRLERINVLCAITVCFSLIYIMFSPLYFSSHDEFLHWRTADDIARSGHLFSSNSLLPTSPFYPGLEIVTNAFSTLSGLTTFQAGILVIGIARLLMILSLFLLYEQITHSSRIAGIASLLYMTNPHFLFFDTGFSYEALALPLAIFLLFIVADHNKLTHHRRWTTLAAFITLSAVVVTHHMTDYILDGLLILWVLIDRIQLPAHLRQSNLTKIALFGIVTSLVWITLKGNPVVEYLSSYFGTALDELGHILTGSDSARQLFASSGSQPTPLWERFVALASVALIVLCLPLSLLCIWQRFRYNTLVRMLGIASLLYPLSHVFRFTNFGSEITDRAAAFLFIPLGCILAIFITQFWPARRLNWKHTALITSALAITFLGGAILGAGPPWGLLPGPYLVGADSRSIEPEGIQTALWANSYLGPNNRVAADRTNRLLMSTYGNQRIVTSLEDGIDVSSIFFSLHLNADDISTLHDAQLRYLVVDLRLSTALPAIGVYFEPGEPGFLKRTKPIDRQALTKFNTIPTINRVFDNGSIVIYDVRELTNAPTK
ncbi:MAG: hypothetical protein NVSMB49_08190 [Ktedonobacteraceae bacterium]